MPHYQTAAQPRNTRAIKLF